MPPEAPAGDDRAHSKSRGGTKPLVAALLAALVGFVLGVVAMWSLGGNPFSDSNEVTYRDVVVGSVGAEGDQLCWPRDPAQLDADQECAVLTLGPGVRPPDVGDEITIGVVALDPPDADARRQVVHVAPAGQPVRED
jgi:hypothetical protein